MMNSPPMLAGNWFPFTRHVQLKLAQKQLFLTDAEMIHLGALAICLERTIHHTHDDHKDVFAKSFISTLEHHVQDLNKNHPMLSCAYKRQDFRKREQKYFPELSSGHGPDEKGGVSLVLPEPAGFETTNDAYPVVELDECFECNKTDEYAQLLRLSQLRYELYDHCYEYYPRATLLHTIACLYGNLRKSSHHNVDIYLFLQITYALVRLHEHKTILLSKHTKSRYFIIWLMYFVECYTDYTFVLKDWTTTFGVSSVETIRDMWTLAVSLTFVRRYVIPSHAMFLAQDLDQWTSFVDRINRFPEIVKLRNAYNFTPLLFNLNP